MVNKRQATIHISLKGTREKGETKKRFIKKIGATEHKPGSCSINNGEYLLDALL